MALNGRVHPNCPSASNPHHECAVACLEKISRGHGVKEEKKSGSILHYAGFGRKKKVPESLPKSPQVVEKNSVKKPVKQADPALSPSYTSIQTHTESTLPFQFSESDYKSGNVTPNRTSTMHASSLAASSSSDEGMVQSYEWNYTSGNVTPDHARSPLRTYASPKAPFLQKISGSVMEHMDASLSNESDEDETQSIISDSLVSVGRYHVRPIVASTLQLIFDKYGDIAAESQLQSASMQAFYLEGVCSVIQELHSTSFNHLTKSKLKEMFAVVRDAASAGIDVSWLREALDELSEAMELTVQHRASQETKSKCDLLIETARKEIESMAEDLALKEKAVADTRTRIADREAQLCELVDEFTDLDDIVDTLWSKLEKFHATTPLGNHILQ